MPRIAPYARYLVVALLACVSGWLLATALGAPRSAAPVSPGTSPGQSVIAVAAPRATATVAPAATVAPTAPPTPTAAPTATPTPAPTHTPEPTAAPTAPPEPTAAPTAPPQPAAAPRQYVFRSIVGERPTDQAVACGTEFASTVWGRVVNTMGRGIHRAVVEVRSTDGRHRFRSTTNSQGGYSIPGLGCTLWRVRLVYVPGEGQLIAAGVTVRLNGGRYSGVNVNFRQQ